MSKLTNEQREQLRNKLVDDLVNSADGDRSFLVGVFSEGTVGISHMSDEELLKAHEDAFDCDFLEQENDSQ
jgi:hypothetical protein